MPPLAQRRIDLTGALAARDNLCRTQTDLRIHKQFQPDTLRWALAHTFTRAPEYRSGFPYAIGALVSMVREGCQINPDAWEVPTVLERAGQSR